MIAASLRLNAFPIRNFFSSLVAFTSCLSRDKTGSHVLETVLKPKATNGNTAVFPGLLAISTIPKNIPGVYGLVRKYTPPVFFWVLSCVAAKFLMPCYWIEVESVLQDSELCAICSYPMDFSSPFMTKEGMSSFWFLGSIFMLLCDTSATKR